MGVKTLRLILGTSLISAFILSFLLIGREMELFVPTLAESLEEIPGAVLALSAILLYMVAGACFITYFEYHGIGPQGGIVRRGPDLPVVSLTFDDGPHPVYTAEILDVLKDKQVKATFFLVGKHVEKYPEVAARITAEGHEIGNHTYRHKDMFSLGVDAVKAEVKQAESAIIKHTGVWPTWFRPPRGVYRESARKAIVQAGYHIVLWSISSLDWRRVKPAVVAKRIKRYLHEGAIILFHDSGSLVRPEGGNRLNTVKSLPLVIDIIREEGYKIISLSEMLELLQRDPGHQPAYERSAF